MATTYKTLDDLPDLPSSKMSAATIVSFKQDTDSSDKWDSTFIYSSTAVAGVTDKVFSWNGIEGATYTFGASSYRDPALIVYDSFGNTMDFVINNAVSFSDYYLAEMMPDFVAPYTGTYYSETLWDSGYYLNDVSFIVYEDLDTATNIDTTSVFVNHLPTGDIKISGTTKQDENLTVASTLADEDGLGDYEYQWLSNGVEITDATLETYKVSAGDIGKTISVKVSYIDGEGTLESVASSATAIVTGKSATEGNDLLIGTNGNDKISGLAGSDTLVGGLGKDTLTGDSGADIFKFSAINETGKTSATRDVITDFKHSEGDKMDLSGIDANSKLAGDQAFKFIGSKSFSGSAGEVRLDSVNKILYGNVNADKIPDFAIQLNGVKSLVIDDFTL